MHLLKECGGGTCRCYQARIHGKLHFVKEIKPEFRENPRMRSAFRKENEMGYSLSHHSLPRYVYLDGIFSPEEYVVAEWIEGLTLDRFLEKNPGYFSDKKNLKEFIHQLSDVMDYLHQEGITHRDIKPSNIMITRQGRRVVLLDLGFASSDSHTLTGGYSPDFASPELIRGEEPGVTSDYYSLGKILRYIENSTPGYSLPYGIKRQVEKILAGSESQREKAYQQLRHPTNTRYPVISLLVILAAGIGGIIFWNVFTPVDEKEPPDNSAAAEVASVTMDSIIQTETISEKEKPAKELIIPEITESKEKTPQIKEKEEVSQSNVAQLAAEKNTAEEISENEERVRKEVRRRMLLYFPPIVERIDSLASQEIYTEEWGKKITRQTENALVRSLNIKNYREIGPMLTDDRIGDILYEESRQYLDANFYPKSAPYYRKVEAAKAHR